MDILQILSTVIPLIADQSLERYLLRRERIPSLRELAEEEGWVGDDERFPGNDALELEVAEAPYIERPGCTAADESIVVLGHLDGLANGREGFGVLATDIERLDRAALGADAMGDSSLASELRAVKDRLPSVRDVAAAKDERDRFASLEAQAWELGLRCGGGSPAIQAARMLAAKLEQGDVTEEEAVNEIRAALMDENGQD